MAFGPHSRAADVRRSPEAHALLNRYAPGALDSPLLTHLPTISLGAITAGGLFAGEQPPDLSVMWEELAQIPGESEVSVPQRAPAPPVSSYEPSLVARGSAPLHPVLDGEQWGMTEIVVDGPSHGNPFSDVELSATFRSVGHVEGVLVHGFYDGGGTYRVRFCPPVAGDWSFHITSNARSIDGLCGSFTVRAAEGPNHGPVAVADQFHFAHADGTRFTPIGTTLYAWTHQPEALRSRTLDTLAGTGFQKVRMCVMPKSYLFNTEEPELYPFERDETGGWDFTRFNPAFFRRFEEGVLKLQELGIEADTILFHAYDRWGFSILPAWADDYYVRYVVRRLAAIRSVWWSLANEYDLLQSKSSSDWERLAAIIREEDHVGHLTSIHNCFGFYDYAQLWITHCSIQRIDVYRTAENVDQWRERWGKPIVLDECAYEGDIDQGWGNISGEEMTRRAWEGAVRGGYVNHGETYLNDRDELWWSKGGSLVGSSPARLAFLLQLIREAPGQKFDPLPSDWDARWAGSSTHRLAYFGFGRPAYRLIRTHPSTRWFVDVIDTWNMTIDTLADAQSGVFQVPLPARPFMAIRLRFQQRKTEQ